MKTLLRLVLRLFPEDVSGIHRSEMEDTFLDGYRASASPFLFATKGLWSLAVNGMGERIKRRARQERGAAGGPGPSTEQGGNRNVLAVLRDDTRLAFRKLTKSLGFTTAAVLTLGVGIGATVAMFSILNAALLQSLPYPDADELVLGRATFDGAMNMSCSFPDYVDHKEGSDALEAMAATYFSPQPLTLTGQETPMRVGVFWVTADFFDALGVEPAMGRTFLPEEGEPDSPFVTVLSHGLWQRWFGGDPDVVGKHLSMAGLQVEIIGVMPAGFRFMFDADLWAPVRLGMFDTEGRRSHSWRVVGRLRDGVTLNQAQAQMDVISAQLAEAYPDSHTGKGMGLVPLGEGLAETYRSGILLLLGATALLLLIACVNVAGLLAARATGRRVEISVKAALGASRSALIRQLLIESVMLAILAGVLGSFLALWIQRVTLAAVPLDFLGVREIGLNGPMLLFALAVSLGTALFFGTGPALATSRAEPAEDLRGSRTSTSGRGGGRARSGLVVAQVALSVVLLTGAGLLIRSFVQLQRVDLGFGTANTITASLYLDPGKYEEEGAKTRFFQEVLGDVRAMPGVVAASFIDKVPIRDRWTNWFIWPVGQPPQGEENGLSTYSRVVMPGYFQTLGIPVLKGRDHSYDDGPRAVPFLVISESTAEALFPNQDPIGRLITVFNGMGNQDYEVLGVVPDFRITSVDRAPSPQMYFNHLARPYPGMHLMVKAQTDPLALVAAIRRAVLDLDPDLPLENVTTLEEVVSGSLSENRLLSLSTALFAITALLLSLTGLYAVLAFYVGRRTREIGIRVACGATGGHVSGMVLRRGLVLVALGLLLGMAGAVSSTGVLRAQLYEVGTVDPMTFGLVVLGFLAVGLLASFMPARRASRVDPVTAIQAE
jgi:predicted permease